MQPEWHPPTRVVAFTLTAVLAAGALYAVVGVHAPHWIKKSRVFHFYLRKASGVEEGTAVWVQGVEAGKVIRMEPDLVPAQFLGGSKSEGKVFGVKVTCRVFSPYHRLLRDGSTVEVLLLSVLGSPRIDVFPGQPGSPRAPDGAILAQRVTRGLEGEVEEILDAGQRMDKTRKEMIYFLDEIEKNLDEITASYESGQSTLYTLVDKKADRTAMKETGSSLEKTAAAIKTSIDGIECDAGCLDRRTAQDLEAALKTSVEGFKLAAEDIGAALRQVKIVILEGNMAADTAKQVSRSLRTFLDKYRVLSWAITVYIPGILADWYSVQRDLVYLGVMRMRMSQIEESGLEETLRWIFRGRLKTMKETPKPDWGPRRKRR